MNKNSSCFSQLLNECAVEWPCILALITQSAHQFRRKSNCAICAVRKRCSRFPSSCLPNTNSDAFYFIIPWYKIQNTCAAQNVLFFAFVWNRTQLTRIVLGQGCFVHIWCVDIDRVLRETKKNLNHIGGVVAFLYYFETTHFWHSRYVGRTPF